MSTVIFTTTLSMSLAEFDTKRVEYVTGMAQALSVSVDSVTIGLVTDVASARRLLATTISVETLVTVPSGNLQNIAAAATSDNMNNSLRSLGIVVESTSPLQVDGMFISAHVKSSDIDVVLVIVAASLAGASIVLCYASYRFYKHHKALERSYIYVQSDNVEMRGAAPNPVYTVNVWG
jgi:hypothetical protein